MIDEGGFRPRAPKLEPLFDSVQTMAVRLNDYFSETYTYKSSSMGMVGDVSVVERLSSGLRINRASDNASSLAISQKIQSQIVASAQGTKNASEAISVIQTSEGALSSVSDILDRMKGLAVQGRNDNLSADQRKSIAAELLQLRDEINAVAERTRYNENSLLKKSLISTLGPNAPAFASTISAVEPRLSVKALDATQADPGNYRLSFGSSSLLANQMSRVSSPLTPLEGADLTQLATVGGSASARTITLSGVFEAGDTIRYTVKGDSPDQTTVKTYTVTSENLTRDNNGFGGVVSGGSDTALSNIAAGMAALYNASNISKPDATADGAVVTFQGAGLTSISVAAEAINRVDQSREVIVTDGDLAEGNRVALSINGKSYEYIVASDSSREDVAEGLRQAVLADHPDTAIRAGSILTIESGSGLTNAAMTYQVYQAASASQIENLASTVSDPTGSATADRVVSIADFDVIEGRRFTISVGNPETSTQFSVIAGTDDDKNTVASKLGGLIQQNFGSGASAVSVSNNQITFSSSLGLGMAAITIAATETVRGDLNTRVGPAQGITDATWGVGGRLDDGVYEILYSESGWSVVRDPLPGSVSTFDGSVLTTSTGNQVNVALTGTPRYGDRYFFEIQNGDPDRTLSRTITATAANGADAAMGTTDDTVVPGIWNDTKLVAVSGGTGTISSGSHVLTYNASLNYWTPSGTTYTATYDGASTVTVIDNPYRSLTSSNFGLTAGYRSGDSISFSVGATGQSGIATLSRSVSGTYSAQSYTTNFVASGYWDFRYNGSSWVATTGGSSSVSGSTVYVSGRNVGSLSSGKEGDVITVGTYAYTANIGTALNPVWETRYQSYLSGRYNDFNGDVTSLGTENPLVEGTYGFSYNGSSWTTTGGPVNAVYNGSIVQNGSGGTSARVTQSFEIRRAETLDASTASANLRTPITGDQMTVDNNTPSYLRVGTTGVRFAVAGILDEGDYILEYNGSDYSIKNAFGDTVLTAQYTTENGVNWLILDPSGGSSADDRVELDLAGTPQVGDKVYFTLTAGNVITNRYVNGSYLGGREDSVSSNFRDRSDRVVTISDSDLAVGNTVSLSFAGKDYVALVESTDDASSIAEKLAGLIDDDFPNTTSATQTPDFPVAARVSASANQITLHYPMLTGNDDIDIQVRTIGSADSVTLTKLGGSGEVLTSETLSLSKVPASGNRQLDFEALGVSLSLENSGLTDLASDEFSRLTGLAADLQVSSVGSDALFQVGANTRSGDYSITGLSDFRLNGASRNTGSSKLAFDQLAARFELLQDGVPAAESNDFYAGLANTIDSVITEVSRSRTGLGVQQNRLEHAISSNGYVFQGLTKVNSDLVEADYGAEMARLTKIQIGQQAATAMAAQANLLPQVILSLLQAQPA